MSSTYPAAAGTRPSRHRGAGSRALFGRESAEEKAVRAGWRGVGITVRLAENGARAPRKGPAPGRQEGR